MKRLAVFAILLSSLALCGCASTGHTGSMTIYVMGDVAKPGRLEMSTRSGIVELLDSVGGWQVTDDMVPYSIVVHRFVDGQYQRAGRFRPRETDLIDTFILQDGDRVEFIAVGL